MKILHIIMALLLILFSIWLFSNEQAAQPGQLSSMHRENASCNDCHVPWRGVSDEMCLNCHEFYDPSQLRPTIRFHLAEKNCVACHKEHAPMQKISRMDHTLLHQDLGCETCHLDPHDRLFGNDCRVCHTISKWKIDGFRHPSEEGGNCNKCHRAPRSHGYSEFRSMILATHPSIKSEDVEVDLRQCWRCHVTHDWRHLRMR